MPMTRPAMAPGGMPPEVVFALARAAAAVGEGWGTPSETVLLSPETAMIWQLLVLWQWCGGGTTAVGEGNSVPTGFTGATAPSCLEIRAGISSMLGVRERWKRVGDISEKLGGRGLELRGA